MELPCIYLVDHNIHMIEAYSKFFNIHDNVKLFHMDFLEFMKSHPEIDGIVSTANSFALFDGGLDLAIAEFYKDENLYKVVQQKIKTYYLGEIPPGSCFEVVVSLDKPVLLITPSMRTPKPIIDPLIVYTCFRSSLVKAIRLGLKNVVFPAFGGDAGDLNERTIAGLSSVAYLDVLDRIQNNRWDNTWDNIFYL